VEQHRDGTNRASLKSQNFELVRVWGERCAVLGQFHTECSLTDQTCVANITSSLLDHVDGSRKLNTSVKVRGGRSLVLSIKPRTCAAIQAVSLACQHRSRKLAAVTLSGTQRVAVAECLSLRKVGCSCCQAKPSGRSRSQRKNRKKNVTEKKPNFDISIGGDVTSYLTVTGSNSELPLSDNITTEDCKSPS
jgi:hypothetical protein